MAAANCTYNSLPFSLDRELRRMLLYARISTIAMLSYYGEDGVPYTDIKDALKLEDGSLGPNLAWLKERGYIESKEESADGRTVTVYHITEDGNAACKKIKLWLDSILKLEEKEL